VKHIAITLQGILVSTAVGQLVGSYEAWVQSLAKVTKIVESYSFMSSISKKCGDKYNNTINMFFL
jgi:hypothetical protein